jgi:Baculoviridae late expression factor 5 C-terminal domain
MLTRIKQYFCKHEFVLEEIYLGSELLRASNMIKNFYMRCKKCKVWNTDQCFRRWN